MQRLYSFILFVATLVFGVYSESTIIISNLPDTFIFIPDRTPINILSLDTAINFKGYVTLSCPGTGFQDLTLEKLPTDSTSPLVHSNHPCECPVPTASCATYSIHSNGIQYEIKGMGHTYYLKPVNVYVNTQTAFLDSIRMIVDSVSFFLKVSVLPKSFLSFQQKQRENAPLKLVNMFGREVPGSPITPGVYFSRSASNCLKILNLRK